MAVTLHPPACGVWQAAQTMLPKWKRGNFSILAAPTADRMAIQVRRGATRNTSSFRPFVRYAGRLCAGVYGEPHKEDLHVGCQGQAQAR